MKKFITMLMVVVLVLSAAGCGKNANDTSSGDTSETSGDTSETQEKITFNLSTPDPEGSSITESAHEFAKRVKEKSNGAIEITVHPNGTLYGGDPSAAVKQLGAGTIDMLLLSTLLYANFTPEFNAISIPYLFDNTDQLLDYLNGEPGDALLEMVGDLDIKGLGLWTRSFRQITNSQRPITSPEDLKGLKLRVPNNPLWVEFFKSAGAAPTPLAFGEVYNALQLKTIDGQENPVDVPMSAKFYEVQKYLTISNHQADGWMVGMNSDKFEKLSLEHKQILIDTTKELQDWKLDYDNNEDAEAIAVLEEEGMEVNELDSENIQKFEEISKELYPIFKELVKNDEFFELTLDFLGKGE